MNLNIEKLLYGLKDNITLLNRLKTFESLFKNITIRTILIPTILNNKEYILF